MKTLQAVSVVFAVLVIVGTTVWAVIDIIARTVAARGL